MLLLAWKYPPAIPLLKRAIVWPDVSGIEAAPVNTRRKLNTEQKYLVYTLLSNIVC
jgi:hypothetical protein